jgi:hypothetical protein
MNYKSTYEDAKNRLKALAKQRDVIDREMQGLIRIMEGAQIIESPAEPAKVPVIPEGTEADSTGFTKTVRLILSRSRMPLVPTEIRDALESMGVEASSPKVLLIHVHNTLRRLFENGEIEQVPLNGKMAYRALTAGDYLVQTMRAHPLGALFGGLSSPLSLPRQGTSGAKNKEEDDEKK